MTNTITSKTAKEIGDRIKEIGAELARFRIVPHPRQRELCAEEEALKEEYRRALNAEGAAKP